MTSQHPEIIRCHGIIQREASLNENQHEKRQWFAT